MSDTAIKIQNLSKLYRLGEVGTGTLSHDLNRWWHRVRGKEDPYQKIGQSNDRTRKAESDYVWALRDINLEVKKGEVLGIIGRNGAGKSTLLKILSQVTSPTTGRVEVFGRIASLLEVGTGFHPELTGRENIFLNGAILGMRRHEIQKKFDEIVDFAGVEAYIDTPVKRYSSGMYVRLAFAVAAFLEPEILVVDEVLAVGDAEFQKKCLGRMKDVSVNEGRTVLFVSHNLDAVRNLCERALLLDAGQERGIGDVESIVNQYRSNGVLDVTGVFRTANNPERDICLTAAELIGKGEWMNGEDFEVSIEVAINNPVEFSFELLVKDANQTPVFFAPLGLLHGHKSAPKESGTRAYSLSLKPPYLASGRYFVDLMVVESGKRFIDYKENVLVFDVQSTFIQGTGWSFKQQRGQGSILVKEIEIREL